MDKEDRLTGLYSKSEEMRGWKTYEYKGLEICIVVVVVLSSLGTVTLTVLEVTLSGSVGPPSGGTAAQSQYGIRKKMAACAYRWRSEPVGKSFAASVTFSYSICCGFVNDREARDAYRSTDLKEG